MGAQRSSNNQPPPGGSRIRQRQRQRLIDACISALHIYGPSRTTVEKVVALADLSPGIVRFYFSSKAAMLLASLAHLAGEFDERVLQPVARLRETPVQALRLLVDLYLDAEIASPRKVSVWYAFWGEASSRQEYYDLCGKKDDDFAALVRDLIERLIRQSDARHLDADAVALGLIGVLEVLWQGFAFQSEANIDRRLAVQRSLAYLRSVFPTAFATTVVAAPAAAAEGEGPRLPAAAYASAPLLAAERERLLRAAWQVLGHESELRRAGDYLTGDLGGERVLVVRGARGHLHAFRNTCRRSPHALLSERRGRLQSAIRCATHDLTYTFEGDLVQGRTPGDLPRLPLLNADGLIFARGEAAAEPAPPPPAWHALGALRPGSVQDFETAADWKVLIEQWLESAPPGADFLAPNQLLLREGAAALILQVLPLGTGSSRVRRFELAAPGPGRKAPRSAWQRRRAHWLQEQLALAASTQSGLLSGAASADAGPVGPQLAEFRRAVAALLGAIS